MRDDEVEHGRFPQGCLDLFTGCGRSPQREKSRPDDGPDANAGQVERTERALQLAIGRGRFSQQMVRTFGLEKLKRHYAKSCHQLLCLVNANFAMRQTTPLL